MNGLLLALGASLAWGVADFVGPWQGRTLGALRVNAWLNVLHIATGALGLLMAGWASRQYALDLGALYTLLAIWGFAIGAGDAIGGFLPASGGDDGLHLALGVLGLAAAAGTPSPRRSRLGPRRRDSARPSSEARAQPVGKGP